MVSVCRSHKHVVKKYRYGTVIGLGITNQDPEIQVNQLMEADLREITTCGRHDRSRTFINPKQKICHSNLGASTCKGDAGAPLVQKQIDGKATCLIGFSVYNDACCDHPDYPSVFISTRAFRS